MSKDVVADIIDNNYSLQPPEYSKVAVIEARLATLAQTTGPGWNQLLTAKELTATRNMEEQNMWMHRLVITFWTIQIHSTIHMPFIHSRPESKAVCLENARSLMFLYECIRAQFTTPAILNIVGFYGFASAVFLETMSNLPEDKKRVERLKEIFEQDSKQSITAPDESNEGTISFQAAQVLEVIRNGCLKSNDSDPSLKVPPPITLPYFGTIRIVDKKITGRSILEDDFNPKPATVALHPPPPTPTIPQVQDELLAMNVSGNSTTYQLFGDAPLNWDFNFAFDHTGADQGADVGGIPMDIEAWTSVAPYVFLLILVLEFIK